MQRRDGICCVTKECWSHAQNQQRKNVCWLLKDSIVEVRREEDWKKKTKRESKLTAQIETFAQEKINYLHVKKKREEGFRILLMIAIGHSSFCSHIRTHLSIYSWLWGRPIFIFKCRCLDTPETGLWVIGTDNEIEFRRTLEKKAY